MSSVIREALRAGIDEEQLLSLLFEELERQVPSELQGDIERFLEVLAQLPVGLRAMAATHQLDVSLTLDDIGWHFANWHHDGYCAETSRGLRELGALELAATFDEAYAIARRHWEEVSELLARTPGTFAEAYFDSALERELRPCDERLRALAGIPSTQPIGGIHRFWLAYAHRHPERLAHEA